MHRKIATMDSSKKSARVKTTAKKTTLKKKTTSGKHQKRRAIKRRVGNVSQTTHICDDDKVQF